MLPRCSVEVIVAAPSATCRRSPPLSLASFYRRQSPSCCPSTAAPARVLVDQLTDGPSVERLASAQIRRDRPHRRTVVSIAVILPRLHWFRSAAERSFRRSLTLSDLPVAGLHPLCSYSAATSACHLSPMSTARSGFGPPPPDTPLSSHRLAC